MLVGLPVAARLPLHEDELHVVLDDGVRLVGFPQELRAVGDLVGGVGDLVPDDRVQVVEADPPADDADVGMEGKDEMASEVAPGDANVADDADQTPAGNQDAVDMPPDLLQLEQECLVVLNVSELVRVLVVPFEIPVGRRRDDKMDRLVRQEGKVPRVPVDQSVSRCFHVFTQTRPNGRQGSWRSAQWKGRPPASRIRPCIPSSAVEVMKAEAV